MQETKYRYENGELHSALTPSLSVLLEHDAMGRLVKRRAVQDGAQESGRNRLALKDLQEQFEYDIHGRIQCASNADSLVQWHYDAVGNLVRESIQYRFLRKPWTVACEHAYDELNRRVATLRPNGSKVQYLTYGSGHVHGMLLDGQEILGFERDDLHRESLRYQGNHLTQKRAYDDAGRLCKLELTPSDTAPVGQAPLGIRRAYLYDAAGQMQQASDSVRGTTRYGYDPLGRLLESANPRLKETFRFDPAGNILPPNGGKAATAQQPAGLSLFSISFLNAMDITKWFPCQSHSVCR